MIPLEYRNAWSVAFPAVQEDLVLVGRIAITLESLDQSAQARREHDRITRIIPSSIRMSHTRGNEYRIPGPAVSIRSA